jgi:hypothetical protein
MDSQVVTKEVQVVSGDSKAAGTLTIRYFSSRERRVRGLKVVGICIALLVAFACIPGAHIILVPLWLLASPFIIMRSWSVPCAISEMNARCAKCQGELSNTNSKERYPIFETCKSCHRENRLVPTHSK